jgi:hypothetical protein
MPLNLRLNSPNSRPATFSSLTRRINLLKIQVQEEFRVIIRRNPDQLPVQLISHRQSPDISNKAASTACLRGPSVTIRTPDYPLWRLTRAK